MFRGSLLTADDPPLSPSRFRGGASGPERTPGRRLFLPPGLSVAPCLPASHALPVRLLFPSPALRPIVQGSDLCLVLFRPSLFASSHQVVRTSRRTRPGFSPFGPSLWSLVLAHACWFASTPPPRSFLGQLLPFHAVPAAPIWFTVVSKTKLLNLFASTVPLHFSLVVTQRTEEGPFLLDPHVRLRPTLWRHLDPG